LLVVEKREKELTKFIARFWVVMPILAVLTPGQIALLAVRVSETSAVSFREVMKPGTGRETLLSTMGQLRDNPVHLP
jgi:hypothetical protein